jgi:BCD family chlorophyll transporter-like MFS transporter
MGAVLIGFGHGLFAVGMLTAAMVFGGKDMAGMTLGAWGAVQATATGVAVFLGGAIRDFGKQLGGNGTFRYCNAVSRRRVSIGLCP